MATEITTTAHPKAANGMTLPLSKSLGLQELAEHRAMVAVELEGLAKTYDRFGWERDRGKVAQDIMITNWMGALQDYPLTEVKAACAQAVLDYPNKMPNQGHILSLIKSGRKKQLAAIPKRQEPEPNINAISQERRAEIMMEFGWTGSTGRKM